MTLSDLRNSKGLLLDTNLLVLLIIGLLSPSQITKHKRTKGGYSEDDFRLLIAFIDQFKTVTTTPNILTEVSNLIEGDYYQGISALAILHRFTANAEEITNDSLPIMTDFSKSYLKFGLSDAVIHTIAQRNYLILTDDLNFCAYLQGQGLFAVNFNNLRTDFLLR
jgi:hypothetical protein